MDEQGVVELSERGKAAQVAHWAALVRRGEGPRMVSDTVRTAARHVRAVRRVDDVAGKLRMLRMLVEPVIGKEIDRPQAASARTVTVRELSDRPIWLRPRSRDRAAFEFIEAGHHLPPPELVDTPAHIAVFGANIGLLLADLAKRYPGARLLGIEPDPENVVLARRNLAHLGDRATIVECAVWHRDETLEVSWGRDAWGLKLADPDDGPDTEITTVDAVDARRLLADFAGDAPVDYLLVNIESAWYEMLRHGDWTGSVRSIKIEIQDHMDEAVPLLKALGYKARLQLLPWGAFAVGVRP